jgi:glycosyltransferase involved in cell wall biosynthesis
MAMGFQSRRLTPLTMAPHYSGSSLAVLVPTKDRPAKIRELLDSLLAQTESCGRILVIDGGESINDVVMAYADRLPVEHHVCRPPGQIRQRNLGISLLDDRSPLVACLDDDIVLEPQAVAAMIAFWNRCEPETAGVSFNIVNTPPEPDTSLRRLFGLAGPQPGRVLKSGATTSNCQAKTSYRAEWLCGGATVWRSEILRNHRHREIPSRWAINEDVVFSYPLGRRFLLYVCADARVAHLHVFDYRAESPDRFHGYTQTLYMLHFVELNPELSRARFTWMIMGTALGRFIVGVFRHERRHTEFARGQLIAFWRGWRTLAAGRDLADLIARDA